MGRSQAVRQRILIPPFGGSIPPAPASQSLNLREVARFARKGRKIRHFVHYWRGLHVTKFGNLRENLPKVSGQIPGYSRFWETFRGDNFDLHWVAAVAVNFSLCSPILEQLEAVSTQRVVWALKFSDASRGGQKTFRLAMNWGSINHSFDSLRFCALPTPEIVAAFEAWHNKKPRGYRKALRELARAQRTYTLLEMEVAN